MDISFSVTTMYVYIIYFLFCKFLHLIYGFFFAVETFYNVMGKTHFTIARNTIEIAITNIQDFYEGNCKIITTGQGPAEWRNG